MKHKSLLVVFGLLVYAALTVYLAPHYKQLLPAAAVESSADVSTELSTISATAPIYLITEPDNGTDFVAEAITHASSSVDLVIYELEDQAVEAALDAATARGVHVRVLLEDVTSFGKHPNDAAYNFLNSRGVPVAWSASYFPLTHQKTLVVDGARAYIMTFNLTPQYYDSSRDFAVVDDAPHDVAAIESAFESDWKRSRATAQTGDDLVWSPGSAPTLLALIASATSSLDVYNEEMADQRITDALKAAAGRGVNVRVDMTYATSWKLALQSLVAAGVNVRTYASTAKLYIHAKMIIADKHEAFVGSENFSGQSLNSNRELGILITKPEIITSLETTFENDWAGSRPFKL